jgi:hypothetical protein
MAFPSLLIDLSIELRKRLKQNERTIELDEYGQIDI